MIICTAFLVLAFEEDPAVKNKDAQSKAVTFFLKYQGEIFHFLLGSLLSAFTIFYFKSTSIQTSGFFFCFLVFLLFINEFGPFQKLGFIVRCCLLQLAIISYATYMVPIILGFINNWTFIISIILSIIFSSGLAFIIFKRGCSNKKLKNQYIFPSALITIIFVSLYFLNAIPPIPLSLQHIGVYQKLEKKGSKYHLTKISKKFLLWPSDEIYLKKGDRVYVFARVFAPGTFKDKIFVRWNKKNEKGLWQEVDRVPLKIKGGRKFGYRGYSYKQNHSPGLWKVIIETSNRLEIGRMNFEILNSLSKEQSVVSSESH